MKTKNHLHSEYSLWVSALVLLVTTIGVEVSADSPTGIPTPQPVIIDSTGNVTLGSVAPRVSSDNVPTLSNTSILCFTTHTGTVDPCLRVDALFTDVTIIRSEPSFPADLSGYDVVYIGYGEGDGLDSHASQFETYVNHGGGLIVSQPSLVGPIDVFPPGFEMTVQSDAWPEFPGFPGPVEFTSAGASHPILDSLTPEDPSGNFDTVPISTLGPGWTVLVKCVEGPYVALSVGTYGAGRLAFHTGNIAGASSDPGSDAYIRQMIEWVRTYRTYLPMIRR
jgi:hypothetical protein